MGDEGATRGGAEPHLVSLFFHAPKSQMSDWESRKHDSMGMSLGAFSHGRMQWGAFGQALKVPRSRSQSPSMIRPSPVLRLSLAHLLDSRPVENGPTIT